MHTAGREASVAREGIAVLDGHLWLVLALTIGPILVLCVTVVALTLSVERSRRVEAIKALPALVSAVVSLCPRPALRPRRANSSTDGADTSGER